MKWAAPAGALSYAIFRDEKSSTTQGGTFTSGAFRTKDLNTSQFNDITGASLASNQITLAAGTYLINAASPAYKVNSHVARLFNITDSTVTLLGSSGYVTGSGDSSAAYSFLNGVFTIAATKVFEIQHRGADTQSTNGFGPATGFQTEVYTSITITKVA